MQKKEWMGARREGGESFCTALCQPAVQLLCIPRGHADMMWQRQPLTETDGKGCAPGLSLMLIGVAAGNFSGDDLDETGGHQLMFMLGS